MNHGLVLYLLFLKMCAIYFLRSLNFEFGLSLAQDGFSIYAVSVDWLMYCSALLGPCSNLLKYVLYVS